jgi:hypothetical protein
MKIYRFVKVGWLAASAMVLVMVLIGFDGKPNSDIEQFLIGSMMVLSFPIGFVAAGVLSAIYALLESCCEIVVKMSYAMLFVEWICFFAAGYWQWFVLLPWVVRKWRTRRVASAR